MCLIHLQLLPLFAQVIAFAFEKFSGFSTGLHAIDSEMSFSIPTDQTQLEQVIDVIYQYHSYYEPPISVEPVLRSETRGLDDADNPNRWWNKAGDWKRD